VKGEEGGDMLGFDVSEEDKESILDSLNVLHKGLEHIRGQK